MSKFYTGLTDEELREEIKQLEDRRDPDLDATGLTLESTGFLEKLRKELELREKLSQ